MKQSQLEKARIPFPQLFASGYEAYCHEVDSVESGFTYKAGIPSSYSSLTGKKVCRADVNGLGRAISQSKWFNQLGGYYTFSEEVSEKIGGYPQGAVLYYRVPETGRLRMVRSLIVNNTYNFVETPDYINDVYWTYCDNIPATAFRPRIFPVLGTPITGSLTIGELLNIDLPCLFMIDSGNSVKDSTGDTEDYYLYLTVKRPEYEEFFTAGLVAYIPSTPATISQGIIADARYTAIQNRFQKSFSAWNSPSQIQVYLSAGDTVQLKGNRQLDALANEKYNYWIIPLTA